MSEHEDPIRMDEPHEPDEHIEEREERDRARPIVVAGLVLLAAAAIVAVGLVLLLGGDDGGDSGSGEDDTRGADDDPATIDDPVAGEVTLDEEGVDQFGRDQYQRSLDAAVAQLEEGGAGVQAAIDEGDVEGLEAFADAWDQAVAELDIVVPPAGVRDEHDALVDAMGELADANRRLVAAAEAGEPVVPVYEEIQQGPAATAFRETQCALQEAGYEVVSADRCPGLDVEDEPEGQDDFGPPGEVTDPPEAFEEE